MSSAAPPPPKPAPGWYPDPAGTGAQRYFDGTNWSSHFSGPAKPTTPYVLFKGVTPLKVLAICGAGFLLVILVVTIFGESDHKKDSGSTSSGSATAAAPVGPMKPDATFTIAGSPNGEVVTARFAIKDNFTNGMIKDGARFETIDILKYVKATYPNASQVNVQGSFPMTDQYGNTKTEVVVNVTYLRATMDKINPDGVSNDRIWEIRDFGFIARAFQP
jgi:hypothetical protein